MPTTSTLSRMPSLSNRDAAPAASLPEAVPSGVALHPAVAGSPGVAPPLRMPYLVNGRGQKNGRQMAKALPVLQAQWTQALYDARRAGRSVAYFQQRKQDLRRAIDLEIDHGMLGETPLSAVYRRLIEEINTILAGMPHVLNKVEGKRLRQLCQQYGEKPEVLLKRPEVRALLQASTDAASRPRPKVERRPKGPRAKRAEERSRSFLMDRWLNA